jgi:ribonuclease BN (tRNA processing enzyme)
MSLHVTILGSGTIIPSLERRATALLVEAGEESYHFDCGPGILEALEETGFSFRSLGKVFFTHFHPDHTLGIGHLLAALNNDQSVEKERVIFYGPNGLADLVKKWNELYRSTVPRGGYLEIVEIGEGDLPLDGSVDIRTIGVDHGDLLALAYRVDFGDVSLVYTGDTAYTESLVEFSKDTDLLVSECSFTDNRPVKGHMTPSQVGHLAARSGARRVVLVHLYPVFEGADPAEGVRRYYGGPVTVARDGMVIDL